MVLIGTFPPFLIKVHRIYRLSGYLFEHFFENMQFEHFVSLELSSSQIKEQTHDLCLGFARETVVISLKGKMIRLAACMFSHLFTSLSPFFMLPNLSFIEPLSSVHLLAVN